MKRSKRAKTRKRTRRAGARRGAERVSNLEAGVFVLLPKDAQEYEPLLFNYRRQRRRNLRSDLVSTPPLPRRKLFYSRTTSGHHVWRKPVSIKMVVFNKLKRRRRTLYIYPKGSYKMTIPKDWTHENDELWDTMTQTF